MPTIWLSQGLNLFKPHRDQGKHQNKHTKCDFRWFFGQEKPKTLVRACEAQNYLYYELHIKISSSQAAVQENHCQTSHQAAMYSLGAWANKDARCKQSHRAHMWWAYPESQTWWATAEEDLVSSTWGLCEFFLMEYYFAFCSMVWVGCCRT